MTRDLFYRSFETAIAANSGSIKGSEQLSELPTWDSMSIVSVLAMADAAGVTLSGKDLRTCKTVEDVRLLFGAAVE